MVSDTLDGVKGQSSSPVHQLQTAYGRVYHRCIELNFHKKSYMADFPIDDQILPVADPEGGFQ